MPEIRNLQPSGAMRGHLEVMGFQPDCTANLRQVDLPGLGERTSNISCLVLGNCVRIEDVNELTAETLAKISESFCRGTTRKCQEVLPASRLVLTRMGKIC